MSADSCWDVERWWDNAFMQEGHLHQFLGWWRMPETIKTNIDELAIHQSVCSFPWMEELTDLMKIHQAAGGMQWAIRFQMSSPKKIALVFLFWRPDANCKLHSCKGAVECLMDIEDIPSTLSSIWLTITQLQSLAVILFAGKVAEVDDEKNVIRSCWDVSAANCTEKLYNIREVTPGLIALAAILAARPRRNALEHTPVSQVDLGTESDLSAEQEFFKEFKVVVTTKLNVDGGTLSPEMVPHVQHQVKEQFSNDSHATVATKITATFPAAEPPIGPAATAAVLTQ
ncbi:uncharacterized protein EI90DRAFT_3021728 [Cantharellus anzutake]|uniref:uncharacterized protein n=1 Tax=Cantharellus anzutake TaxID=1750568 RepID=UPI001905F25F|nr:uncharacterized protein EI90DRAFT_3021728 [Cantharellus anzutake]KAF8315985.1 hypothetical protein EI90DRAFT_3021728 [Cantharellus anzutake]